MNWPALMALGLGAMRLPPAVFWAMTPREFTAALSALQPAPAPPMTREALDNLSARYPDRQAHAD